MKDNGIDKSLVKDFNTSDIGAKGLFGFRRLFSEYLKKLNIPFWDTCCPSQQQYYPIRYNSNIDKLQYFDGTEWITMDPDSFLLQEDGDFLLQENGDKIIL